MVHSGESLGGNREDGCSAQLMKLAQAVFDNTENAKRWMATPNLILGATPLDLLGTDEGAKRVEDELTRIEHGDFA